MNTICYKCYIELYFKKNNGDVMKRLMFIFIVLFVFLNSLFSQKVKIATYNTFFLDENISMERKARLNTVIKNLNTDIIAFQEIEDLKALKNILPDNYSIAMLDDPEEILEVALAIRSPFKIIEKKYIFPGDSVDYFFPRTRDLLQVKISGYGKNFVFLVHHTKSRRGGRMKTDIRRETASALIVEYIKNNLTDENVVLIGDFNDNPDDKSVNILEMGSTKVSGGIDKEEDVFLFNTTERLLDLDNCSYGLYYILESKPGNAYLSVVKGAREENNKWRNMKFNYYKDIKIKAALFDQILVSMNLKNKVIEAGVYKGVDAVKGTKSKIKFVKGKIQYTFRGTFASDHIPVWVVLDFNGESNQ